MKKVLLGLSAVAALAVAGLAVAVAIQPDTVHVERSIVVDAAPSDVYPHVADFRSFVEWSPWSGMDPNQTSEFSDPSAGVEAWYSWSGNDEVGTGKLTVTRAVENERVDQRLEFTAPFVSESQVSFVLAPEGEGTRVTWTYDDDVDLMMKPMFLVMDMDTMLGGEYEKGLAGLKALAEKSAAERIEAERVAAEEAAAEGEEAAADVEEEEPAAAAAP